MFKKERKNMRFAEKFANFVIKARWWLFGLFLLLTIAGAVGYMFVGVNYDMTKYLPANSDTRIAIEKMTEEYGSNATVSMMLENVTLEQIAEVKSGVLDIEGVATLICDTDDSGYCKPTGEISPQGEPLYDALYKIFFTGSDYDLVTENAVNQIKDYCDAYQTSLAGTAIESIASRNAIDTEMVIILIVAVLIVLVILTLTSRSWIEPVVYLMVIACAIVMNMGSNIILGEISFVTQSISAIMLIALEMDYCIVLCNRFREEKSKGIDSKTAITQALANSVKSIIACSLTVMLGLLALCFMDFSIGFDMGFVLAKGVFISILAVIFFMPSIILMFDRGLTKTEHKSFLPNLKKIGTFAHKTRFVIPALFLCLVVAGVVLQGNLQFSYVTNSISPNSAEGQQVTKIEDTFGKQNTLVLILPNDDRRAEIDLYNKIMDIRVGGEATDPDDETKTISYIYSAMALANSDAYFYGNYVDYTSKYDSLDEEIVKQCIANMLGKECAEVIIDDKVYAMDLIKYLHVNKEAEFVQTFIGRLAGSIDYKYEALYKEVNYQALMELYGLDQPTAMQVVGAIIGGVPTETDTVLHYQAMEVMYPSNPQAFAEAVAPMTHVQAEESTGVGSMAMKQIYEILSLDYDTDTIKGYEIINILHSQNGIIKTAVYDAIDSNYDMIVDAEKSLCSENCVRMILNLNLDVTDEHAVSFINQLHDVLADSEYSEYYIINATQNLIDTESTFASDRTKTDLITIIGILLLVMLLMRSISLPVLLVFAIQGAIWINLGINTLLGHGVYFICYLLAMAIQMGATIDYGIILSDRYVEFRKQFGKVEALKMALNTAFPTVITSGLILIVAAYSIHFISSTPMISEIGSLIGQGALISVIVVLFVLPQLLLLFDKIIQKTTYKSNFVADVKENLKDKNDAKNSQ